MRYTLDDFQKCAVDDILTTDIKEKIDSLVSKLGISINEVRKVKRGRGEGKNDNWEKHRPDPNFKTTVFEEKVGKEKILTQVMACLNKLNEKNYEKGKEQIIEILAQLDKEEGDNSSDIIDIFVNTSLSNPFYCKHYIKMLLEAVLIQEQYNDTFIKRDFIQDYKNRLQQIEYVSSDEDFNKHCNINKENDRRRGLCIFIIELVVQQVYDEENLYNIFTYLIEVLEENETDKALTNITEEIVENINVLFTTSYDIIKSQHYFDNIKETLRRCKEKKDKAGITKRMLFKFMDICDKL
uniref:MIF4G domain-containing protein n=1 Tax=viral metagenome TaxID=1070528 RepID=A0A6C0IQX0_9ZZZZ